MATNYQKLLELSKKPTRMEDLRGAERTGVVTENKQESGLKSAATTLALKELSVRISARVTCEEKPVAQVEKSQAPAGQAAEEQEAVEASEPVTEKAVDAEEKSAEKAG